MYDMLRVRSHYFDARTGMSGLHTSSGSFSAGLPSSVLATGCTCGHASHRTNRLPGETGSYKQGKSRPRSAMMEA